jgi:hypothetical protein
MSPGHPSGYRKAVINTQEKIQEGFPVIYEAAFQHEGVLIFLDILVHTATGWHAYEVKSSAGISDTYRMDAALQYYVIHGTGIGLQGISLIHINREYVRSGAIDPDNLFKVVNVTDEALSRQEYIKEQILKEKETLNLPHSPKIPVGKHCREPYDCDFIGHCWKNEPKEQAKEPLDHFDKDLVRSILPNKDSVAFLKLLCMKHAIPEYDGTQPYQEIPYGYSLSIRGEKTSRLFTPETNPEPGLTADLNENLSNIDTVVVFNQSHLLRDLLPDNIKVIDHEDNLIPESELRNVNEGDSLLARIFAISGSGKPFSTYTSDTVCTHYYFEDPESTEVQTSVKTYAEEWVAGIEALYEMLITG